MAINDVAQSMSLALWHITGAEVFQVPCATIARTGMINSGLNKVVVSKELCPESIHHLLSEPKLRDIPYSLMIPTHYHTKLIEKQIVHHGLYPRIAMTSMVCDIATSDFFPITHAVLRSHAIDPMPFFWESCFGFSKSSALAYYEGVKHHFQGADLCQYFVYDSDEPIGCGWLLVQGMQAGLFYIATLPSARNKGVGTSVVRALLQEAKLRGCQQAALIALPWAKNLYKSVGFIDSQEYTMFN